MRCRSRICIRRICAFVPLLPFFKLFPSLATESLNPFFGVGETDYGIVLEFLENMSPLLPLTDPRSKYARERIMPATVLSQQEFSDLTKLDTCTISNAIETFGVRLRNTGYADASVRCMFNDFTPMVGYAATARLRSEDPPVDRTHLHDRSEWWQSILQVPAPRIVVLEDMDKSPGAGAFIGDVHAAILRRAGLHRSSHQRCSARVAQGPRNGIPPVRREYRCVPCIRPHIPFWFGGYRTLKPKAEVGHLLIRQAIQWTIQAEYHACCQGGVTMVQCSHLDQIRVTSSDSHVCEECVKMGDRWVHLRLCLECGHVGCCDSSKNKHATKHFHRTKHPLIRSNEPGEDWVWCYVDELEPGELIGGKLVPLAG